LYVKIFSQILDSSLADDPKLRHFFMDILLLSDHDGNVIMTPNSIKNRLRCKLEDVEWGLQELQKPDPMSLNKDNQGRRLIPLDGHGYGWKILNYHIYRDYKSAREMREASAERVRRWREKNKKEPKVGKTPREIAFVKALNNGDQAEADRIAEMRSTSSGE
jgi:hypothetical protein